MSKKSKSISNKAGLPPGTLIHVGKRKTENVRITVIDYNGEELIERECSTPQDCFDFKDKDSVTWINVDGLHDVETIDALGKHFELHPLIIEDILNTQHRPKAEEFEKYLFFTMKMLGVNKTGTGIVSEQITFVLGKGWVISFQEQEGDILDGLRERLRTGKGNTRQKQADYLLYRLLDTVVDNYFFVTEYISEAVIQLEEYVLKNPDQEALVRIQSLKKQLVSLRRKISPLREALSTIHRDSLFFQEDTQAYLRDVYEHTVQLNESIDTQRDMLGGIMDLYLSGVSNKMNQVMQVLTIIATIFIPLTFIAGIYGMNFDHMPELHWEYGYQAVWGLMGVVLILMIIYFRRKRWL